MFGEELKRLREENGLVQRQLAAELGVDTAYISKIESNGKPVSRQHLKKLSLILDVNEKKLLTIWLADKIFDFLKDEDVALEAMQVARRHVLNVKYKKKKR